MKYIDLHCDTISRLYETEKDKKVSATEGRITEKEETLPPKTSETGTVIEENLRENQGHLDLLRMKKGGCLAQNFALFTNLKREADPYEYCMALYKCFKSQMEENADLIRQALTVDEILENERAGLMSAVLTLEEGAVCRDDVRILDEFYRLGVRMMTLTWNYENGLAFPNRIDWSNGSVKPETERGLTKKGIEFVEHMEQLGMIVDVAHLGDAGIWDVLRCTRKPFTASHSNARSLSGHVRNLPDGMIRAIADRGGVIGINYCPVFLSAEEPDGSAGRSRVCDIVRHIRHIKQVGGIECVGLGSDWDGILGILEIDSPAAMYLLEAELERHGFTGEEIEKIFYKNALRLYRDVWK